jgi:hypothetical protein
LAIVFRYKKKASIIYYRVAPGVSSANFDKSGQTGGADATPPTGGTTNPPQTAIPTL